MAEIINYKYFLGCPDRSSVKEWYKKLVKEHHPDKPTGSHEAFIQVQAEYKELCNSVSVTFPIAQPVYQSMMETFDDMTAFFRRQAESEKVTQLNEKELALQRALDHFNKLRETDVMYDVIDDIVEAKSKYNKNDYYCIVQLNRLDDLDIDHFKYLSFVLRKPITFAHIAYKQYKKTKVGW